MSLNNNICEHGLLKRSCYTCDLENEVKLLKRVIQKAIDTTHDDDTHEFLNRALEGKENEGPSYRIKLDD